MNEIDKLNNTEYKNTLKIIIKDIKKARYEMLKKVNKETVKLYWHIGKTVFIKIEQNDWGKSIVEKLSKDLHIEFPGVRGFSARNIWRMKTFYETYSDSEILPPSVAEIGWSQNYLFIEKRKDKNERLFYLKQIKAYGRSKSDLKEKIESHYFQNKLLSQDNFPTKS